MIMTEQPRLTLITSSETKPAIDWNYELCQREQMAFMQTKNGLKLALEASVSGIGLDVERVIVDRAGSAEDFLELLATLPSEVTADMIFIRDNGAGFLSATGRGGDRMLYALAAEDIRFYLEAYDLVTANVALRMSA